MKERYFNNAPRTRFSFSQVAQAIMQPRSAILSFRNAQRAVNTGHSRMESARTAFMAQRYMSLCYLPSMH